MQKLGSKGLVFFEEIGSRLGISTEEARREYHSAINKIRGFLRENPTYAEELHRHLDERDSSTPRGATAASNRLIQNVLDCGFEWEEEDDSL